MCLEEGEEEKKRYLSKSDEGAVGCWGLWMLGFKKDQGVSLAV